MKTLRRLRNVGSYSPVTSQTMFNTGTVNSRLTLAKMVLTAFTEVYLAGIKTKDCIYCL